MSFQPLLRNIRIMVQVLVFVSVILFQGIIYSPLIPRAHAYEKVITTNNATSRIAITISDVATSITVNPGTGALFPDPTTTAGTYAPATLYDASDNKEIVYITERVGDVLTVERGKEGTTPRTWPVGTGIGCRLTANIIDDKLRNPIDHVYHVNVFATDQCAVGSAGSLDDYSLGDINEYLDSSGTRALVVLPQKSTDYTLTAPITITANMTLEAHKGAIIASSPVNTITFAEGSSIIDSGGQLFSGGGVDLSGITNEYVPIYWFGALGDGNKNLMTSGITTTHPEAAKINAVFGFPYTSITQDSAAIQETIKAAAGKKIFVPYTGNRYWISPLFARDNTHIVFEGDSVEWKADEVTLDEANGMVVTTGLVGTHCMLRIQNVSNVRIDGNGARLISTYHEGEFQKDGAIGSQLLNHHILVAGAKDVVIKDLYGYGASGDAVILNELPASWTDISSITGNTDPSTMRHNMNVRVSGIHASSNGRQGISINDGVNVRVTDCKLENQYGKSPECGMDIEPNEAGSIMRDVVVSRIETHDNNGGGVAVSPHFFSINTSDLWLDEDGFETAASQGNFYGKVNTITVRDSHSNKDRFRSFGCGQRTSTFLNADIKIINCIAENSLSSSFVWKNNTWAKVLFRDCTAINPNARMTKAVTAANDILNFQYDGGATTACDIADGNYTEMSLPAAIRTAINTAFGITSYVTYDGSRRKYIISVGAGHTLKYIDSGSDAGDLCGFTVDGTAARVATSDTTIDFTGAVTNPWTSTDYHSNSGFYLAGEDGLCDVFSNVKIERCKAVDLRPVIIAINVATTEPSVGDDFIGGTSGATGKVMEVNWPTTITVTGNVNGTFSAAETMYNITNGSTIGTIDSVTDERTMYYGLSTDFATGATGTQAVNKVIVNELEIEGAISQSTGSMIIDTSMGDPANNYWKYFNIFPTKEKKNSPHYHNSASQSFQIYPGHSGWLFSNRWYSSGNRTWILPEAKKGLEFSFINERGSNRTIILPSDYLTITSANDVLQMEYDGGATTPVDVADGSYTGATAATALKAAIDTAFTINATVTYATVTRSFSIDVGGGHTIKYVDLGSDGGDSFGFTADTVAAQTNTSDTYAIFDNVIRGINGSAGAGALISGTPTAGVVGYGSMVTLKCKWGGSWTIESLDGPWYDSVGWQSELEIAGGVLGLAGGGTGSSLSDPGANRLWGWDDTDNDMRFWILGPGLTYVPGTDTIDVTVASTTVAGKAELAIIAETSAGSDAGRVVTPDGLAGSVFGERYVSWVIKPSDALTVVADGTEPFPVPSGMAGFELKDLTCTVTNLNGAAADSTVVVVRRCRAGACVDMTSTGTSVAFGSYTESDETVDAANDELALGDELFADVNGICTPAHMGLSCTATFRLP